MPQNIRNIAIIAHVDHGKTTLVDKLLNAGQVFAKHQSAGELIMDNNDLEKERGITILAKNVAISYKDHKINIIDTPGHSDFGGEVERVLNMADAVCLLVDAFEGPMPQTRFVLQKALELGLKPILVINKVDKENCTPEEVLDKVFDLMFELGANQDQLDFKTLYGSAKNGWLAFDWKTPTTSIEPLLDTIIETVKPKEIQEGNTQMLITSLDYSAFVGRIAVGRLNRGELKENMPVVLFKRDGKTIKSKINEVFIFEGLEKRKVASVQAGDICAVTGLEGFEIGDCICDPIEPDPLDPIAVDEPTMSMVFSINDSPFFGKEGKFVTSRNIRERLEKELEKNLALRVQYTDSADKFLVYGRGVLHLSVLIETMRREGYELQVGQPQVLLKEIDGKKHEPIEELNIDVPEESSSTVIGIVSARKGNMTSMETKGTRCIIHFTIPSRGIIGLRSELLTATAGEVVMSHRFTEYGPFVQGIPERNNGALIADGLGTTTTYALDKLQDSGIFFVEPGEEIYGGQVIGENTRPNDLVINASREKKLTNMRASGTDEKSSLRPAKKFTLEGALEYIQSDEYVEVTPKSIRIRKIFLNEADRKRNQK